MEDKRRLPEMKRIGCSAFVFALAVLLMMPFLSLGEELPEIKLVSDIVLSETDVVLTAGNSKVITAEVCPQDAANPKVEWSSSDESVASVTKGKIIAKSKGKCDIVCLATDESSTKAICHVEVRIPVKSIAINEKQAVVMVGASDELSTAKLTYAVAPEESYWQEVTWETSDEDIVTVAADGTIRGLKPGKAVITALSTQPDSKVKAQAQVVVQQSVESIELDDDSLCISIGKKGSIKATVNPSNASNKKLQWASQDETIAKVTTNGQITGIGVGKTIVTATATDGSGVSVMIAVEIVQPVRKIEVADNKIILAPSTYWNQEITVSPENATNKEIIWTSSNENVATVNATGVITGQAQGSCNITGLAADGSNVKISVGVRVKDYDVVFTDNWGKKVDFETNNSSSSFIGVTNRGPLTYYEETTVSFKNGYVVSGGTNTLMPVETGEDVVTVTVTRNGRRVSSRNYTVYVARDAFQPIKEKKEEEENKEQEEENDSSSETTSDLIEDYLRQKGNRQDSIKAGAVLKCNGTLPEGYSLEGPGEVTVVIELSNTGDEEFPGPVKLYYPDMTQVEEFGSTTIAAGETRKWEGKWMVTQKVLDEGSFAFYARYSVTDKESGELKEKAKKLNFKINYR